MKTICKRSLVIAVLLFAFIACKPQEKTSTADLMESGLKENINYQSNIPFDSALINPFFISFPKLEKYKMDITAIYQNHHFNHIWFDNKGVIESGNSLYSKVKGLETEGVSLRFPYVDKLDGVFEEEIENTLNTTETELMLSCTFLF